VKNILSIQLIGFNKKNHQILASILDSALTEELEVLSIDCFEDHFKKSITGADISILDFAACQSSLSHHRPHNQQHCIILCVDNDDLPVEKYLESWPIFDVWDIRNINESRIRLSVKNLLNDTESKTQIEILQAGLNQYKSTVQNQGTPKNRVNLKLDLREIQKTFNYSPCAVVIVNLTGEIEYINP